MLNFVLQHVCINKDNESLNRLHAVSGIVAFDWPTGTELCVVATFAHSSPISAISCFGSLNSVWKFNCRLLVCFG